MAMETATQMREMGGIVTKSALNIASVEKIKGDSKTEVIDTKAEDEDPKDISDMYLFNFENEQGYVLMSGDERIPGVLAYSSMGHLGDSINPGQGILLERAYNYVQNERKKFEEMEKLLLAKAQKDMFFEFPKKQQDSLIQAGIFDKEGNFISESTKASTLASGTSVSSSHKFVSATNPVFHHKITPIVQTLWSQSGNSPNAHYNKYVSLVCPNSSGWKSLCRLRSRSCRTNNVKAQKTYCF